MKIGIIGLAQSGKSTTFDLLQGGHAARAAVEPGKGRTGTIKVPDSRIDALSRLFNPKKTTYSDIEFVDFAALTSGSSRTALAAKLLSEIKTVDGLLHVVRCFRDENVYHAEGGIDPVKDFRTLAEELHLSDLILVEQRLEKVAASVKKGSKHEAGEQHLLERLKELLENGKRLTELTDLKAEEEGLMRSYGMVTAKPMVTVLNLDEEQFRNPAEPMTAAFREALPDQTVLRLSARVETDISGLDSEEERKMFLEDLGMTEPGRTRLIRTCYEMLQYISFFTVGEDEVRAWTIRKGTNAQRSAGKIHTDLEKGFIRAEVVPYDDLLRLEGSLAAAKKEAVLRLEGKEYVVKDGDVLNIRFNV